MYRLENLDSQTVKSSHDHVFDVSASHDNIAQYYVTPKDPSRSTHMIPIEHITWDSTLR